MKEKKIDKNVITNRKALRDFFIEKKYEAGIELFGNEVKSIRLGKANLKGSFARIKNGEVFVHNIHITPYKYSADDIDPVRPRKLLLHRQEIKQLLIKTEQKGYTLVPLRMYFKKGFVKVELALAHGKKLYDKRHALKEKEAKREIDKATKHKGKI